MTDAEEGFEQIGHEPRHFASKLFMDLLNKSYMYLLVFIALAVVCLVVVFWLPFLILILSYQCPATSNSMNATLSPSAVSSLSLCRPPISEAHDAWDAFAVAFASLFSVPTNYSANSVAAVTLVTIEFAVGKLAVAALTALLVIKVSRVPNNLVLSSRVLVHKPNDHWMLSMRIGILHKQTISGLHVRVNAVMRQDGMSKFHDFDLPLDQSKLRAGYNALKQEPMSFSHTVNENSPLYGLNFSRVHSLKKELLYVILSVHGFDDITGRSLGIEKRYNYDRWNKTGGTIVVKERGFMADVVLRLSENVKKATGANHSLAIQWPNFNLIKETSKGKVKSNNKSSTSASVGNGSQYSVPAGDNAKGIRQRNIHNSNGNTASAIVEEENGEWRSKKDDDGSISDRDHNNAAPSPNGSFNGSFTHHLPISQEAQSLSPRTLTNEIALLTDKLHRILQPKTMRNGEIHVKSEQGETREEIERKRKEKKHKIDRTRIEWTTSHLELAQRKFDHLKNTIIIKKSGLSTKEITNKGPLDDVV
jgi:hypothetical protein